MPATDNSNGLPVNRPATVPRRGSGWSIVLRIAIGTAFASFGSLAIAGSVFSLLLRINQDGPFKWDNLPWPFKFWEVVFQLIPAALGGVMIAAAVSVVCGRWKRGLILAALAFGALWIPHSATEPARHFLQSDPIVAPPVKAPQR